MKPRKQQWVFVALHCFLIGSVVDSSSLPPAPDSLSVSSLVGHRAVLPCSWKRRLGERAAPPPCHVQWATPADTVFEQRGARRWQAEEFRGRVEVPEENLGSGDCSLIISDVQIGDTGRYESFMVVDGHGDVKTRVFIQSVKLSVFDHKSLQSRGPGEDLVLDLYTRHSVRVVFQGRNGSEWEDLWMRGDADSPRLQKHPLGEQLTITRLTSADQGTYKVLDADGLAVSTVQLSVNGKHTARKSYQSQENQAAADARSSCSALLVSSLLLTGFQILLLL
ncbi:galectin 17 [Etheostoma spectabile]|uniref:galectin 17 n=1 Tax=Etheostoma spectabile TaxID=54343 RepID=UPI0013AE9430|nr:uncharacterized protein LOC116691937 [Etheostoma spectabile]